MNRDREARLAEQVELVACGSRAEYLAVLLGAHAECCRIPVLGSAAECEALARELDVLAVPSAHYVDSQRRDVLLAQLTEERDEPRLVVVLDDQYELFAAALALFSKRTLVRTEPSELFRLQRYRNALSVTLVAAPEQLNAELLCQLANLTPGASPLPAIGVLTAHSEAALSRVVVRSLLLARSSVQKRYSVVRYPVQASQRDDHTLVRWDDFGRDHAAELAANPYSILSVTSHGDPIDLHLNGVVMCGRPSAQPEIHAAPSLEHSCMVDDYCPRNRGGTVPRLAIDRLQSRVIVAETCSGIALRSRVFPSALSIALSALDGGACAFLSTIKVLRTTGLSAQLASTLLTNGHTLGDCARLVNVAHCQITGDAPSFLLIGDAEARFAPRDAELSASVELPEDGVLDWRAATHFEGTLLRLELTGPHAARLANGSRLSVHVEQLTPELLADAEVFAIATVHDSTLSVLLVAARRFELGAVRLSITDATRSLANIASSLARLERRLCQLAAIAQSVAQAGSQPLKPAHQLCVEQLGLLLAHGRRVLERGVSQLDAAQICATAVPAAPLQQSLALMLQEELAALDGSLAQGFPSWGLTHYQVPLYAALMTAVGPERSAGPCYRCGLPSFELEQHAPARPDLKRIFTHCPACDVLFDRLQDETPVQIHGVNPVVSGSTVTRELHIANHHDTPRLFAASLFIEGDYPWFEVRFEPAAAAFEVAPGAVLIAPFEVHVHPRTAPGVYRLTAFTTSDLSWSLSVEPFVVSRPSAAPIFLRTQGGAVGGMQRKH